MSPGSRGSSGSVVRTPVGLLPVGDASSTTATTDPLRARPTALAAACSVAARTVRAPWSTPVASAPKHRTDTVGARRPRASWYSAGVLTLTSDSNPGSAAASAGSASSAASSSSLHVAPLEQRLRPQRAGVDERGDPRGEAGAVGGGERLDVAPGHRERDVERRVRSQLAHHAADERGVQVGQVDGADGGHRRVPGRHGQTGGDALQRTAAGHRVVHDLHARWQRGQPLLRRPDHEHGPVDRPGGDPHRALQQRRAVPLEARLGAAHPGGATADEDDRLPRVGYCRSPRRLYATIEPSNQCRRGIGAFPTSRTAGPRRRVTHGGPARRPPDERGADRARARTGEGMVTTTQPEERGRSAAIADGLAFMARWSLRLALIGLGLRPAVVAHRPAVGDRDAGPAGPADHHRPEPARQLDAAPGRATRARRRRRPGELAAAARARVVYFLATSITGGVSEIASGAVAGLQSIQDWLSGPPLNIGATQFDALLQQVTQRLQDSVTTIATGVLTGVGTFASLVVTGLLALVLAFLFVKDGDRFLPWLRRFVGPRAGGHLCVVLGRVWDTLGGFIRGQALVSLADAVLIGAGLLIVGVPLALPLAVLTFIGGFIPIVGAHLRRGAGGAHRAGQQRLHRRADRARASCCSCSRWRATSCSRSCRARA